MRDHTGPQEDYKSKKQDFDSLANKEKEEASSADCTVEMPAANANGESQGPPRRIHRAPPQLRVNKMHVYDPVVLSLGPYHHGQPQFRQLEELKDDVLNMFVSTTAPNDIGVIRGKILDRIDEIRSQYVGISANVCNDEALAVMILRDACFIIHYMEVTTGNREKEYFFLYHLGLSGLAFVASDCIMLENQIPLWVIKLLIGLKSDVDKALICKFSSSACFGDDRLTRTPWEEAERESLHLLELQRAALFRQEGEVTMAQPSLLHRIFELITCRRWGRTRNSESQSVFKLASRPFRSVTDLKAKGIHFRPSSNCLSDIRFYSYTFYGLLQLPIWFVTNNTRVFFSNMTALQMSPETKTDGAMISYVNFMKSLIESPKDVKELRRKGILFSNLGSDEEVVKVFKEIDTYGIDNVDIFLKVKMRIDEHCGSLAKTWMAELAYTYFRNPWTAIALFAATFLLCLTVVQTYFAVHPASGN